MTEEDSHNRPRYVSSFSSFFHKIFLLALPSLFNKKANISRSITSRHRGKVKLYSFFNFKSRWREVVKAKLRLVSPLGRNTLPVYRRLDEPQGRYGKFWEILLPLGSNLRNFGP
jgi:hypothetical protein